MKEVYIDIMEKALSAYTEEQIHSYIQKVKHEGLVEHGFPRLGANIGILMAHGKRLELKDVFIQIIDLCLDGFAHPINASKAGNNFAIREVCFCIMELQKSHVINAEQLKKWKDKIAGFDIPTVYTHIVSDQNPTPANWAYFAALSEQARGILCGFDATEFVENQLPSQLLRLDENGMYRDHALTGPYQPVAYDIVTRTLIGLSLWLGYNGKYVSQIEKMMELSDALTLKMQSVTGELAFGGRSNQCTHNEMMLASYCELRASLIYQKGDVEKAGQFKAAAEKAQKAALWWLEQKPMSHIKNRFDPDLRLGCEDYAYFNKYMITVASNAYLAYLAADDEIEPSVAVADLGGFVAQTGDDFHKVFVNAGGYSLEFDTNADLQYDAKGLGRVHKKNCDPRICLSVPFPAMQAKYKLETPNSMPMSISGFRMTADGRKVASQDAEYVLKAKTECGNKATATFDCFADGRLLFTEEYTVWDSGVDITLKGADGIFLPAFMFDGKESTEILTEEGSITVRYNGSFCRYTFSGDYTEEGVFFNRNGSYRVYRVYTKKVHIEMGEMNEL